MSKPDQTSRHTDLLFVQPTMLKAVGLAAAVWGVGVPIVLAIKTGDARLLLLAPLGLLLVPAIIVLAMFGRVLLWLHLVLFWYIRGALAAVSLLVFAGLSCALLVTPSQWIDQTAGRVADLLPSNAIAVGAIVGIVGIASIAAYAIARGRRPIGYQKTDQKKRITETPSSTTPAAPAPGAPSSSSSGRPLTYLQHRQDKDSP